MKSLWFLVFPALTLGLDLRRKQFGEVFDETFDYVIVGGGTAGLTMANRLSADPKQTVAVIEAGTAYQVTDPLMATTPAGGSLFFESDRFDINPSVDWTFITQPQAGANGRHIHYVRSKSLGGSSARNFMIYQRGSKQSYQKWADLVGDDSYTWDALQPYFQRSINFTQPSRSRRFPNATVDFNDAAFSPKGGPLHVSYPHYAQPFSTWLGPALEEVGVRPVQDFNSGELLGAQYCATTIEPNHQKRESSQTSFLEEAYTRFNLKIYAGTLATKILIDSDKKAAGVSASIGPLNFILKARKEVILSAGAFQSPQLLMVSGVGPRAQLEKFRIPVIADRPGVGQGMEDHVFFGPTWRVKVQTLSRLANDPAYVKKQFHNFFKLRKEGPLTNPVLDFIGWEKLPRKLLTAEARRVLDAEYPADWPELEYLSAPGFVGDFFNLFSTQPKDGQYATNLGGLVAPRSRGTVTLQSADARKPPLIDPNWLTDPTDISVALAAYKRLRQVFGTKAMRGVLADDTEYFPGPGNKTDAQILRVIGDTAMTMWHAACTCRMGKADDPMAVVDKDARVIGVRDLRVVDASSFALLPPGHPQSTVYALAEKIAAEMIARPYPINPWERFEWPEPDVFCHKERISRLILAGIPKRLMEQWEEESRGCSIARARPAAYLDHLQSWF